MKLEGMFTLIYKRKKFVLFHLRIWKPKSLWSNPPKTRSSWMRWPSQPYDWLTPMLKIIKKINRFAKINLPDQIRLTKEVPYLAEIKKAKKVLLRPLPFSYRGRRFVNANYRSSPVTALTTSVSSKSGKLESAPISSKSYINKNRT